MNKKWIQSSLSFAVMSLMVINAQAEEQILAEKENLKLTTIGKSEVKFEKVDIKSLSGSLSDSTYINLPTYQLRKLMN